MKHANCCRKLGPGREVANNGPSQGGVERPDPAWHEGPGLAGPARVTEQQGSLLSLCSVTAALSPPASFLSCPVTFLYTAADLC